MKYLYSFQVNFGVLFTVVSCNMICKCGHLVPVWRLGLVDFALVVKRIVVKYLPSNSIGFSFGWFYCTPTQDRSYAAKDTCESVCGVENKNCRKHIVVLM